MYDLLSKYLAGEISVEEKRILFQQLKENEELRKEAPGYKIYPRLFLWRMKREQFWIGNIARLSACARNVRCYSVCVK